MKLLIKNMVCPRCIIAVKEILESEGVTLKSISLGEAETVEELSCGQRLSIAGKLQATGFELLDDPRSQLIEQIRIAVQQWVRMDGERPKMSDCLSQRLNRDYSALSKLFSEVRGITIERFAITHRIEYAKDCSVTASSPQARWPISLDTVRRRTSPRSSSRSRA